MRFTFFDIIARLLFLPKAIPEIKEEPSEQQKLPATSLTLVERPIGADGKSGTIDATEPSGRQWHDLRGEPRTKSRGESKGYREWSSIRGITLHQTAVDFGTNPRRLLNVPVHGATLRDGSIVLLHDPTDYMYHANSFNKHDIGIEVSCRASGIEGNADTLWLPKSLRGKGEPLSHASEATDDQLEATRVLIMHYVDLVESKGGKIEYIHAHRQSSKSRTSDPGSRIWRECGVWAIDELKLTAGPPGWSSGGYPLPDAWTGERNGIKYSWKVAGLDIDLDPGDSNA